MLANNAKSLRWIECGFSQADAADYLDLSKRQYQRQESSGLAPRPVMLALESRAGYVHAPGWEGWRLHGEYLITPDGQKIPRGALRAWSYIEQYYREAVKAGQLSLFD